jgi:hypothetical protein
LGARVEIFRGKLIDQRATLSFCQRRDGFVSAIWRRRIRLAFTGPTLGNATSSSWTF